MKAYIASESLGIDTSAGLVRKVFREAIELGRRYGSDGDVNDLYESLRLLGTGLHCIEGKFDLLLGRRYWTRANAVKIILRIPTTSNWPSASWAWTHSPMLVMIPQLKWKGKPSFLSSLEPSA